MRTRDSVMQPKTSGFYGFCFDKKLDCVDFCLYVRESRNLGVAS